MRRLVNLAPLLFAPILLLWFLGLDHAEEGGQRHSENNLVNPQ